MIEALIRQHGADRVMMQDHETQYASQDHSDHVHASLFAGTGVSLAMANAEGYVGYGSQWLAANVSPSDVVLSRETLFEYVVHDEALALGTDASGNPVILSQYETWLHRQYYTDDFQYTAPNTWARDRNMRALGDVNGDGVADLAGFSDYGVEIIASRDEGFRTEARWVNDYSYQNGGWRMSQSAPAAAAQAASSTCSPTELPATVTENGSRPALARAVVSTSAQRSAKVSFSTSVASPSTVMPWQPA